MIRNPAVPRRQSPVRPAGRRRSAWRAVLEAGASLLQDRAPLADFDIYVAGLHCARDDPGMQMEAHHYCRQVNHDLLQCVLFDGNTRDANLIGIEYIVSERLFATLPDDEKPSWHPHNYEILSGQLVAPGLPEVAERAFLKELVNSYGKTWHTWHTGRHDGEPGDRVPLGPPMLMWSFNRDGEADEALRRDFQKHMRIDEAGNRARRGGFAAIARPQRGVDAMAPCFPGSRPLPGVVDVDRPAGVDGR